MCVFVCDGGGGDVVLMFWVPNCDLRNSCASLFVSESKDVPDTHGNIAERYSAAESEVKDKIN